MQDGRPENDSRLRLAQEADAEGVLEIYAPAVRDTFISFEMEVPAPEEIRRRIRTTLERWPWLVCEDEGGLLGYAYASEHRSRAAYQWSVDVAVYVHPRGRRRGVGRALYGALLPVLSAQGYYNVYAGIALPNPGSVGLHEAVGFQRLGTYRRVGYKLGAWRDVGWWEMALRPHEDAPGQPRPLPQLQDRAVLEKACATGLALLRPAQWT